MRSPEAELPQGNTTEKFHQKVKGLTHGFWRLLDHLQPFEIKLKYECFGQTIKFGTALSLFRLNVFNIWRWKMLCLFLLTEENIHHYYEGLFSSENKKQAGKQKLPPANRNHTVSGSCITGSKHNFLLPIFHYIVLY